MESDVLKELAMGSREEAVRFLKSLWTEKPMGCPRCGGSLDFMHKKAKKSNSDWVCKDCGKVYKAITILDSLNEK